MQHDVITIGVYSRPIFKLHKFGFFHKMFRMWEPSILEEGKTDHTLVFKMKIFFVFTILISKLI